MINSTIYAEQTERLVVTQLGVNWAESSFREYNLRVAY